LFCSAVGFIEKTMTNTLPSFETIRDELEACENYEERYRLLIELGRLLEPMPEALKNETTRVQGCSSQVWLYAQAHADNDGVLSFHFLADSDAHIVRGLVAVLLSLIQGRSAEAILALDARAQLGTLGLAGHLSPTRTNGFFAMVARVQALASQPRNAA
jgi:cysteine desulfuration protein SufE